MGSVFLGRHPCLDCGACCASLRVSFYWGETQGDYAVPEALTVKISPFRAAMRGTEHHPSRCDALLGDVGSPVRCTIYANRPSPCREFRASWENGKVDTRCDEVRAMHGLPPLTPKTWRRRRRRWAA